MSNQVYVITSDNGIALGKAFESWQDAAARRTFGVNIRVLHMGDKGWKNAKTRGTVYALTIEPGTGFSRADFPTGADAAPLYDGIYPWAYGSEADAENKADTLGDDERDITVEALDLVRAIGTPVADMRFVKPLDEALLGELAASHDYLVTLEDGALLGGAGSAVNEALQRLRLYRPVLNLGLPDRFIEQGTQEEIYQLLGLDSAGIEQSIREFITAPSV